MPGAKPGAVSRHAGPRRRPRQISAANLSAASSPIVSTRSERGPTPVILSAAKDLPANPSESEKSSEVSMAQYRRLAMLLATIVLLGLAGPAPRPAAAQA